MVQSSKKIALLHRYPKDRIRETNAAFPYLEACNVDVLTFKKFDRMNDRKKRIKSALWIFYAPLLVIFKKYDVIYCDDSFPFYPALVKLVSPKSKVIIRLGDFHLMYYLKGKTYDFYHYFEKLTWKMVDGIIAISDAMAYEIEKEVGIIPHVVYDPIEPLDFVPNKMSKKEDKIVMFHGLLTRNKGLDIMIKAALKRPKIWFWIVGDGPDLIRLQKIAPKNVVFTGWHDFNQMYSLINTCTVGLALRNDNPGNEYVVTSPFLQYGVMGKPCLVTKRKVFKNYKWQFSGVDEMVKKIDILMRRPSEGDKLRKYILRKHNANKIARKIWKILTSQL